MSDDKWGPGDPEKFKPFTKVMVGDRAFELGHGEHPYSRQDNRLYVRRRPGDGFTGFNGHRLPWHIEITEGNYMKSSGLSGNEIRRSCQAKLYWDLAVEARVHREGDPSPGRKLVYAIGGREAEEVMMQLPLIMVKLGEFSVQLWKGGPGEFPDLIGRKIYYRDTPATVTMYFPDQGAVVIESVDGVAFPVEAWKLEEDEDHIDDWPQGQIKDGLFSDHIWWFRKD